MIYKIENPTYNFFYSPFRDNVNSLETSRVHSPPYVHQSSYSVDFPKTPTRIQKVVNVSNIPFDLTPPKKEEEDDLHYLDHIYDGSTDFSSGFNSFTLFDKFSSGTFGVWEKKTHGRTHSEPTEEKSVSSWLSSSVIKPPPGFE